MLSPSSVTSRLTALLHRSEGLRGYLLMAPTLLVGTDFDPTMFAAQYPGPVLPGFGQRIGVIAF